MNSKVVTIEVHEKASKGIAKAKKFFETDFNQDVFKKAGYRLRTHYPKRNFKDMLVIIDPRGDRREIEATQLGTINELLFNLFGIKNK